MTRRTVAGSALAFIGVAGATIAASADGIDNILALTIPSAIVLLIAAALLAHQD